MVETQRKIYNGNFDLTPDQKRSFKPLNINGLIGFFQKCVSTEKVRDLMQEYGIPSDLKADNSLFFKALAYQFKGFIDSSGQDAEDIILMEYQHLLEHGDTPSETPIQTKYPNDSVLISPNQIRNHQIACHEKNMVHEWIIQNRGQREWKGRRLYFANHAEVKPRAASVYVDIPDTQPGEYIKVATSMDARRHEGKTVCHWIMLDDQGDDCFPNSNTFDFSLIADFVYVSKSTEV